MESRLTEEKSSVKATRRFTPIYDGLAEAHNNITSKTNRAASRKSLATDPHHDKEEIEMKAATRTEILSRLTRGEDRSFPAASIKGSYDKSHHPLNRPSAIASSSQDSPLGPFSRDVEWPTIGDFEDVHFNRQEQHNNNFGGSLAIRPSESGSEFRGAAPYIPSPYETFVDWQLSVMQQPSSVYAASATQQSSQLQPASRRIAFGIEPQISYPSSLSPNPSFLHLKERFPHSFQGQSIVSDHGPVIRSAASWADLDQGPGPDIGLKAPVPPSPTPEVRFSNAGLKNRNRSGQRYTSSMGEGSTVENIVKQYGTDDFHDVDLHSGYDDDTDDEDPFGLKAPSSDIVLHVRLNQSPRQLVHVPAMPGMSKKRQHKPVPPAREPPPVPPPGSAEFGYVSRQPSNPFHPKSIEARKKKEAADLKEEAAKVAKRFNTKKALERDVSQALRHHGDSEMTLKEVLSSGRESRHAGLQELEALVNSDHNTGDGARSQLGFYPFQTIPVIWNNVDKVRVPIEPGEFDKNHKMMIGNRGQHADQEQLTDDAADNEDGWETVLGSQVASRQPSATGGKEVRFQKAGSSVADNSSRGNISFVSVDYEHFSSTDKIVAHPARIDGIHDFRTREASFGAVPVLMPIYRKHKTNGFLQNSSRFPPSPHRSPCSSPYQQPTPMAPHENPFLSSPPSNFSPLTPTQVNKWKGKGVDRNIHGGYDLSSDKHLREPVKPKAAYRQPYIENEDEYGNCIEYDDENNNQWVQMSINGDASECVRRDRTPLIRQPMSFQIARLKKKKQHRTALLPLPIRDDIKQQNAAKTFYQQVRSKFVRGNDADSHSKTTPRQNLKNTQRQSQTRPQCLRDGPVPETPFNSDGTPPKSFTKQEAFAFRSPLAPVRRESWQALYTKAQLATFRERAQSNGIDDLEGRWVPTGTDNNRRGSYPGRAMKTVGYAPNLFRFNYRPDEDVEESEHTVSALCLAICCLFPPILFLYYTGYFDFVMAWRTRGQTLQMQKRHKKLAFWLAPTLTFGICVIIIAVVLSVHFAHSE